jgi:hypothetical protein
MLELTILVRWWGRTANYVCNHVTQAKAFTTLYQVRSLLEKPCGDCRLNGMCLVETEAQVGIFQILLIIESLCS